MGLISSLSSVKGAIVDLQSIGVIPNDATKNVDNVGIINALIQTYKAAGKPLIMDLPEGDTYIGKAGTNWSIYFDDGCTNMVLRGRGKRASTLIQHDVGTGNDWFGILADRAEVALCDFGMRQGEIEIPSAGQHDHLIQVANFGGSTGRADVTMSRLFLGKCLGDCINFYGGTGIVSATARDIDIDAYGFVLKTWQASHAYATGSMIRGGTNCYYATTGGVSASGGGGPTGTGSGITDGSVVWSTLVGGATYRFAARSGIAFQRGYDGVLIDGFRIKGIQNSGVDMESSSNGTLQHANFANGIVYNGTASPDPVTGHKGNTSTIFSFSGSTSQTDPSKYSSVDNVVLINGSMQIAETRQARVSRVRIVQEEPPQADTATACMYVQQSNDGLVLESCQLHRVGTSAAGELLNIQGTGKVTVAGAWTLEQTTAADLIGGEPSNDLAFDGTFNWKYSGSSPSTKAVVNLTALNRDADRPKVRGFRGESTSGAMKALVVLSTRAAKASLDIAPLTANCETVVRAKSVGTGGNSLTLAFVADGSGTGSLTQSGNALTFHYESGVTTVANFETAVAASTIIEVGTSDGSGTLTSPGDTFSATAFTGGASRKMRDISITDCTAKDGSLLTGVYFSKQAGSVMDANPIIQACSFGDGVPMYTDVDEGDNPTDNIFPLIDGSRNDGAYTLTGLVDPVANVKATQGARYVWQNGDSTELYLKTEQTGKGGWAKVTTAAAEDAPFDMPTDAASWSAHIADNVLSVAAPTRSWSCQDASGDLTPSIGSISLVDAGTPTYENDESALGYPNVDGTQSVGLQDGDADEFSTADSSLPDPSTTSMMMVVIGRFTSASGPAASRSWFQMSETNIVRAVDSGGNLRGRIFFVNNDVTPAVDYDTDFHVWVGRVNETANTALFGNELFKSEPGYVSASTTAKRIGLGAFPADIATCPGFRALRIYQWEGANAEITNTQLKELLESFGAGVVWAP